MPAGGPLSVRPPPPPSAWRFFLPASGNGANKLPVSTVRRHRRPPSFGRGFYYGRWRRFVCHRPSIHRCPRSRLLLFRRCGFACALAAPAGEGVVPPELRPDATTPAPPTCSFRSVGIIRPVSVLKPVADHASSSPPAGYCQRRASVWLVCGSPSRCGHDRRSAPQPSRIRLRPPAPTPRRTAANEQPVPALAVAGPS